LLTSGQFNPSTNPSTRIRKSSHRIYGGSRGIDAPESKSPIDVASATGSFTHAVEDHPASIRSRGQVFAAGVEDRGFIPGTNPSTRIWKIGYATKSRSSLASSRSLPTCRLSGLPLQDAKSSRTHLAQGVWHAWVSTTKTKIGWAANSCLQIERRAHVESHFRNRQPHLRAGRP